jgi:hypothetical protein
MALCEQGLIWKCWFSFIAYKPGPGGTKVEVARSSEAVGMCGPGPGGYRMVRRNYQAEEALRKLVGGLTTNGWHYTNTGQYWYSDKFKRLA